jgi:hypothetical protein
LATICGFCNYFDEVTVFNNNLDTTTTSSFNDFHVDILNKTEFKDTLILSLTKLATMPTKFNDDCDALNTTAKLIFL